MTRWLRRLTLATVLVATGCAMLSDVTWRERRQAKIRAELRHVDRVDMGVALHVVERDANGHQLIEGAPPLRIVRTHRRGGMVAIRSEDGKRVAQWCGPSRSPVTWYCSREQEPLILHGDDLPLWLLIQGSEGSGKTTIIPQWAAFRAFEHIGTDREIGITAPTNKRMAHIKRAIAQHWPAHWYRYVDDTKLYTFHAGPRVQLVSAHQQSEAEGSPIQGFNWVAHAGDELQDHYEKDADIIARGRSAPGGKYRRLNTSTFKDAPGWRDFRGKVETNDRWQLVKLLGMQSPFVHPEHWESMRKGLTPREYRRRVLAQDVGPERQVYYAWSRKECELLDVDGSTVVRNGKTVIRPGNVRPRPIVGSTDVTMRELAPWAPNASILLGHDPGKRKDVTLFLKAYQVNGAKEPWWFVVDEVTTEGVIYEGHVATVLKRLRDVWGVEKYDGRGVLQTTRALVRADPYTDNGRDENHPDVTAYRVWQQNRLDIRPAAFRPGTNLRTVVPREGRIDMVNTLLCNMNGECRLFVAEESGRIAAPKLVDALESMERDDANNAEHEKKDERDKSHWPAALGYALWAIEKPRIERLRGAA